MAQAITAPGDVILCPNPDLSDPCLRLHHVGRRDPLAPGRAGREFHPGARARGVKHSIPRAARADPPTTPRTLPRMWRRSTSTGTWSPSRRSTTSSSCRIWPIRRSISTARRRLPSCRFRARWMSPSSSRRCRKLLHAGWRMGFAVGNERLIAALTRVKSYLDYGAFTPIQVAATTAHEFGTAPKSPKCATSTTSVATSWWTRSGARAGPFRRQRRRCLPGLPFGAVPGARIARILEASRREKADVAWRGNWFRRARRRLCPHRARGKRAPDPAGCTQHQALPFFRRGQADNVIPLSARR